MTIPEAIAYFGNLADGAAEAIAAFDVAFENLQHSEDNRMVAWIEAGKAGAAAQAVQAAAVKHALADL